MHIICGKLGERHKVTEAHKHYSVYCYSADAPVEQASPQRDNVLEDNQLNKSTSAFCAAAPGTAKGRNVLLLFDVFLLNK